jgi:hypothetical protein
LVESTNNILIQILRKTIDINQINWHLKSIDALWVSILTPKDNTGNSPHALIYGKEERIPINLELNAFTYAVNIEYVELVSPLQKKIQSIDEVRRQTSRSIK